MILMKGGRVIDPEKKKEWKADVALDGQKIAAIGEIEDDDSRRIQPWFGLRDSYIILFLGNR